MAGIFDTNVSTETKPSEDAIPTEPKPVDISNTDKPLEELVTVTKVDLASTEEDKSKAEDVKDALDNFNIQYNDITTAVGRFIADNKVEYRTAVAQYIKRLRQYVQQIEVDMGNGKY